MIFFNVSLRKITSAASAELFQIRVSARALHYSIIIPFIPLKSLPEGVFNRKIKICGS